MVPTSWASDVTQISRIRTFCTFPLAAASVSSSPEQDLVFSEYLRVGPLGHSQPCFSHSIYGKEDCRVPKISPRVNCSSSASHSLLPVSSPFCKTGETLPCSKQS